MKKRRVMMIVMILSLALIAVGITYGVLMFSYTKIGSTNEQLVTGDIYMHYIENNELVIQNAMLRNSYDPTKYFEFSVDGKNTTTNHDIYYDILLQRGSVPNGKVEANRILDRFLKFRLVSVENNVETEIFNNKSYGDLVNSKRVYVETIPRNTTTEISHMYRLYMWIGNDVIIANTEYDDKDYEITEWNNLFGSVKVNVTGDFEVKTVPRNLNDIMSQSAVLDNIASTNVTSSTGINFAKSSGDTDSDGILDNGEGIYTLASTENDPYPIMYYRGNVTNNNVLFADKCWKIVRTTESGGVKLIYNGEYTEENICNNTGEDSLMTLNENGVDTNKFPFNEGSNETRSPAYVGYMYNDLYFFSYGHPTATFKNTYFGTGFTYENGVYRLLDPVKITSLNLLATHHYTCDLTTPDGTCAQIRYYTSAFSQSGQAFITYINLSNGKSIGDALEDMKANVHDSTAKSKVDKWYEDNMSSYTSLLEDTIWCNDREIFDLGAFNPNGGNISDGSYLYYELRNRMVNSMQPELICRNKNDRFTVSNSRGNKKLDYPIGLITADEIAFAGAILGTQNNYLIINKSNWTMTPESVRNATYSDIAVGGFGGLSIIASGGAENIGLRPAISLSLRESITGGTGTVSDPYVVE